MADKSKYEDKTVEELKSGIGSDRFKINYLNARQDQDLPLWGDVDDLKRNVLFRQLALKKADQAGRAGLRDVVSGVGSYLSDFANSPAVNDVANRTGSIQTLVKYGGADPDSKWLHDAKTSELKNVAEGLERDPSHGNEQEYQRIKEDSIKTLKGAFKDAFPGSLGKLEKEMSLEDLSKLASLYNGKEYGKEKPTDEEVPVAEDSGSLLQKLAQKLTQKFSNKSRA